MAILQDDDARFKGLEKKTGLFAIVAVIGILLTIAIIGFRHDLFAPKTRLFFVTDSAQGIESGMAVKLSGFRIGQVERLELTDKARVMVRLSITDRYMPMVRTDSRARQVSEGVIGSNIIEVTPGTETAAVLTENSQIEFARERGLSQMAGDLYSEVVPLIDDMKRVVTRMDSLLAGLPAILDKMDSALTSANKSFSNLEQMTATDLPVLTREGREAIKKAAKSMDKADKIVDSVSRTWPIRGNIEQPRAETLPVDSYTEGGDKKPK